MDYSQQVNELRKKREDLINKYRHEYKIENQNFDYFPIDAKWKIPVSIIPRTPKGVIKDYKIGYQKVGRVDFKLDTLQVKADLYTIENQSDKYHIGLKDMTSGQGSYGTGRFVPILKEADHYFVDFNLAFTPVCGHVESDTAIIACPNFRDNLAFKIEAGEKTPTHGWIDKNFSFKKETTPL